MGVFVPCSFEITCWERADLVALIRVMFYCVFVTFPYGVLGQVWYLIVTIPDICLLFCLTLNQSIGFLKKNIFRLLCSSSKWAKLYERSKVLTFVSIIIVSQG